MCSLWRKSRLSDRRICWAVYLANEKGITTAFHLCKQRFCTADWISIAFLLSQSQGGMQAIKITATEFNSHILLINVWLKELLFVSMLRDYVSELRPGVHPPDDKYGEQNLKLKLWHYTPRRRHSSYSFSNSAQDRGAWSASRPGRV